MIATFLGVPSFGPDGPGEGDVATGTAPLMACLFLTFWIPNEIPSTVADFDPICAYIVPGVILYIVEVCCLLVAVHAVVENRPNLLWFSFAEVSMRMVYFFQKCCMFVMLFCTSAVRTVSVDGFLECVVAKVVGFVGTLICLVMLRYLLKLFYILLTLYKKMKSPIVLV
ncbi:hypothetical protein QR680_010780 [Steinernema hermaphroditum]|uniref:Uncharacterized protein n=1 Tax=Steinernema hermaphroditum TaxID=289476 RepID=A0AA39IRL1_9BILA|nr:hypothetical protein QR680_010780 [Steinernema hermaphroditum]